MKRFILFLGMLSVLPWRLEAQNANIGENYGWSMDVELEAGYDVYKMAIPLDVYHGAYYSDLSDLLLLDSRGNSLPFKIQNESNRYIRKNDRYEVPVFPVYLSKRQNDENLSLYFQTNSEGTIIQLKRAEPSEEPRQPSYFIADLSKIENASELILEPQSKDSAVTVQIYGSFDLQSWTFLSEKTVYQMQYQNREIKNSQIPLLGASYKYLKIQNPGPGVFLIKTLFVNTMEEKIIPAQDTVKVNPSKQENETVYDARGTLPVKFIRIPDIPKNAGFEIKVYTKTGPKDRWTFVKSEFVYNLSVDSKHLRLDTVSFPVQKGRYWKIENEQLSPAAIELGYQPQSLVFFLSGTPPLRLVYGSTEKPPRENTVDKLIREIQQNKDMELRYGDATPGAVFIQKGNVLTAKKHIAGYFLWGVLASAFLLLMFMAKNLYSQIQTEKTNKKPNV